MSDHLSSAFDQRLPVDVHASLSAVSIHVRSSSTPSPACPLPFLPMELKREVILHCNQPTLAAMSLVSLAMFELAAPVLYRDVTVEGVEGLERLLLPRGPDGNSDVIRLAHLGVSLDLGQIMSFTYVSPECEGIDLRTALAGSIGHLPQAELLAVRDLTVITYFPTRCPENVDASWERYLSHVMDLFDPVTCAISVAPPYSFAYVQIGEVTWSRLETLSFADLGPLWYSTDSALHRATGTVEVVYDLQRTHLSSDHPWFANYEHNALDDVLGGSNGVFGPPFEPENSLVDSDRVSHVVLQVTRETQARQIWGRIQVIWGESDIDDEQQERWASKLLFELVDKNDRYRFVRKPRVDMNGSEYDLVEVS